jgi:two-component system cell cycle sensor histidine kinase/response regulator CckA
MDDIERAELIDRVERLERELEDCRRRLRQEPGVAPDAAKEWEQSPNLLRGIISALHDTIIFGIDRKGKFLFAWADPALGKRYGFDTRSIFEKGLSNIFPPEALAKRLEILQRLFKTGEPFREEYPLRGPSGEFWHDASMAPVRDSRGDVSAVIGIVRDITERKRTEALLRESEERYRSAVDQVGDYIIIHRNGEILFANKSAAHVAGLENGKDLIGMSLVDLAHPDSRDVIRGRVAQLQEGRDVIPWMEQMFKKADGGEVFGELISRRISYKGSPAVLVVVRDITGRKRVEEEHRRLEERIRAAEKFSSLGMLAGGVAHDYNNLLMGILGNAALLLDGLPGESPYYARLRSIEKAAQHAAELTRQLQTYSGGGELVSKPTDLDELVRGMSDLLSATISKRIGVEFDFAEDVPAVEADATQLRQVIMNLVRNAAEAIGDRGGTIIVRTRLIRADRSLLDSTYLQNDMAEGSCVSIEVVDDGPGMEAETLSRIFDPFFSTKQTGRGLGLAVVLGIVRRHGGALRVDSRPGGGTVFQLLFPLSARRSEEDRAGKESVGSIRDWRGDGLVLVVDDEEHVRSVASAMLKAAGFEVKTASGGCEAVKEFGERPGDFVAVLLDMTMPDMSGEQVLRDLKQIRGDIPVILSSGFTSSEIIDSFAAGDLGGFLRKPYRPAELLEKICRTLKR